MTKLREEVDGVRSALWRDTLAKHEGNISRAAREFGFSKQRGHALTRRHGLVDEARGMRLAAGQKATGRPKGV